MYIRGKKFSYVLCMKGYGRLIATAREQVGMGPDDLAARLGKGRTIVYRLESEQQEPTAEQINVLTATLPISAEALLRAMGVNLHPPATAKLPAQLVNKLLALSPERLHALTELLPEPER